MNNPSPTPGETPERKHPVLLSEEDEQGSPALEGAPDAEASEDKLENDGGADYELQGPAWQGWAFALLPIAVILLGAGREAWSRGLAAVLTAVVLLLFPVRRRLPPLAAIGLLGALLAPLLVFLPQSVRLQAPEWWTSLQTDWGIELSQTLTPQAWVAWESWLYFALCLVWLGWCMARGFSTEQRRGLLQMLAMGGIVICALAMMEHLRWIGMPWWPRNPLSWGEAFGPFANRNHTSSVAAITCLLAAAAAYDAHRRKSRGWMIFVLGMLVPLSCIFMNTSKAGVVLLFIGLTTWFGTVAMRKSFFQKMAMAATLIFVIAALIIMSEGAMAKRIKSEDFSVEGTRTTLLVETLTMATQAPWLGVGLGNFEAVFPLVSTLDEQRTRFIHPESDILWLLAEGGLLTFVPAGLLVFWIFNATGPWFGRKKKGASNRLDRRLRNSAAIAFGMGALHGVADVPNHALGFALLMALLAGIAIRPRRLRRASGWTDRLTFRVAGLGVLAMGIGWIGVSLGHPLIPGRATSEALRTRANQLTDSGSVADALPLMSEAIRLAPMNFHLYFERARMHLLRTGDKQAALLDFSRSRTLEPHYAALCYQEGVIWLGFDAQYAVIGWREFLKRYPAAAPGIYGYYRQMLNHASRYPELREALWSLATSADLKLDFLNSVTTREEFDRCLRSLLAEPHGLEALESSQRTALFELWGRLGDENTLMAALEANKKWREDGWRFLAVYYAKKSDFRSACQTVSAYLPSLSRSTPGLNGDIASMERALLYNPADARIGIDLFQAQKNQGDIDGALRTLEKIAALPNAPTYVRQEMAALYMAKEDYRRAWEQFQLAMAQR